MAGWAFQNPARAVLITRHSSSQGTPFMKRAFLTTTAFATLLAASVTGAAASGTHDNAIGKPGVAAKATRTVQVDMTDGMRFTPADISVKQGETVRFVVRNSGKLKH